MSEPGHRRAFTLIELLVVVSIIGLLSSIVTASLNSARDKGRIAAARQFSGQIERAIGDQALGIWDFDECSGTVANDRSGNGFDGALNNMATSSWSSNTPSGSGCALSFDGSNDYISIPDNDSLDLADNFTTSMWVYMRATGGQGLISKGDSTIHGAALAYGWNSNGFEFINWNACNSPYAPFTGSDLNRWNHIVGVVDGGIRSLYVNGSLKGTPTNCGGTGTWNNARNLIIGASFYSGAYANAIIDEVRVFSRTLTATEVRRLYAESARASQFAEGE